MHTAPARAGAAGPPQPAAGRPPAPPPPPRAGPAPGPAALPHQATGPAPRPLPGASSRRCRPARPTAAGTQRRPRPALLRGASAPGPPPPAPGLAGARGRPPRREACPEALDPGRGAPPPPREAAPGAPHAPRGLTGAGPARRSSGPSSDGKWRALLLLLMDGGATPATRGVSRNCFQGPLLHPLRASRSQRAGGGAYEKREAGRAVPPGDQ